MQNFFKLEKYKMVLAIVIFVVMPFPLFMNIDDFGTTFNFVLLGTFITLLGYIMGPYYTLDIFMLLLFLYFLGSYVLSCVVLWIYRKHKAQRDF